MPTHAEAFVAFHASEKIIMGFFCRWKGFVPLSTGLFKVPAVFLYVTGLAKLVSNDKLVVYH